MDRRSLDQLIDTVNPAWPLVQEWIAAATNPVEVLPAARSQGEQTLLGLQVTTRSPMGAIALETGGLLIDHGWLRVPGAGSPRMSGNLLTWNGMDGKAGIESLPRALIVAHDASGGFFALNGGRFAGEPGSVFYFAPDTLAWQPLTFGYSGLVQWSLAGNVEHFYTSVRWPGWEDEVAALSGDQGFSIYPPLWTSAGGPVAQRSRRAVPMHELWGMHQELAQQLRNPSGGSQGQ